MAVGCALTIDDAHMAAGGLIRSSVSGDANCCRTCWLKCQTSNSIILSMSYSKRGNKENQSCGTTSLVVP